jgi:hypothetical protein
MTPLASSAPYTSGESLREYAEIKNFSDKKFPIGGKNHEQRNNNT